VLRWPVSDSLVVRHDNGSATEHDPWTTDLDLALDRRFLGRSPPLATLGWLRAGDRLTIVEDMTMIGGEDDDAASLRCGSQ
jgi:hypothetical protein